MFVCKDCGSDDLVSVETIKANCGITRIFRDENGALVPSFDGYTSIDWDTQETDAFMCAACFLVAPDLKSLVKEV